jgi:hypothetical protein
METISACARSERRNAAWAWFGKFQSEVNLPCPVFLSSSGEYQNGCGVHEVENAGRLC